MPDWVRASRRWIRTIVLTALAAALVLAVAITVAAAESGGHDRRDAEDVAPNHVAELSVAGDIGDNWAAGLPDVKIRPESAPAPASGSTMTTPSAGTATTTVPTVTAVPNPPATPILGDAIGSSPAPATTPVTRELSEAAGDLASEIEALYGIRLFTEGQDWGSDTAIQLRNLGWVAAALDSLPPGILEDVQRNPGGPLTVLSNDGGRTVEGWQPYGNRAANFYTNEDRDADGARAANQIVLQPGSTAQTIAHEVLHGYQMRNVGPSEYVLALLTDEMKSFMQATGWHQLVSDDEIHAAASENWAAVNAFFEYEGRPLSYIALDGQLAHLYAPNPLEAFAEAGALYYAHHPALSLPDWPDYWGWFDANVN